MPDTNTSKNVATVKAIGRGERLLGATADELVGPNFGSLADKTAAAAEATRLVTEFVGDTKEQQSKRVGGKSVKTDFGAGFGSLVSAVKGRLLSKGATDWLRLVEQATKNAHANGENVEDIMLAVKRGMESAADPE